MTLRHTQRNNNVPLRRVRPVAKSSTIPLRNLTIQLLFSHRLHRRLQDRPIWRHRAADMPEPYANVWWTQ